MRGWFPLATSGVRGAVEISCLGAFLVAFFFLSRGKGELDDTMLPKIRVSGVHLLPYSFNLLGICSY